jgi:hypothetical protein
VTIYLPRAGAAERVCNDAKSTGDEWALATTLSHTRKERGLSDTPAEFFLFASTVRVYACVRGV